MPNCCKSNCQTTCVASYANTKHWNRKSSSITMRTLFPLHTTIAYNQTVETKLAPLIHSQTYVFVSSTLGCHALPSPADAGRRHDTGSRIHLNYEPHQAHTKSKFISTSLIPSCCNRLRQRHVVFVIVRRPFTMLFIRRTKGIWIWKLHKHRTRTHISIYYYTPSITHENTYKSNQGLFRIYITWFVSRYRCIFSDMLMVWWLSSCGCSVCLLLQRFSFKKYWAGLCVCVFDGYSRASMCIVSESIKFLSARVHRKGDLWVEAPKRNCKRLVRMKQWQSKRGLLLVSEC